jgi:hypothetical protein
MLFTTLYQQFHMPLQILHEQFSRQCLSKGLGKGRSLEGQSLPKHVSPSIKLSTKLNLHPRAQLPGQRKTPTCAGKDKVNNKSTHVPSPAEWHAHQPLGCGNPSLLEIPTVNNPPQSLSCSLADGRAQNVASESNDSKASKGPNCLLNV